MAVGLNTAQIKDRAREQGINLSEQQAQDILSQAYDPNQFGADPGRVQDLLRSGGQPQTADSYINDVFAELSKPFDEANQRAQKFEQDNPFIFDEELARASAEERLDPFYHAELSDYLAGVNNQRGRTTEDEKRLRQELTQSTESYVGSARRDLEEAIRSSREGFSGAGLFFGGQRVKSENITNISGEQNISDYLRQQDLRSKESKLRESRTFEDLSLQEATKRRQIGAERETAFLTDVGQQSEEARRAHELERQQYIGYPLSTGSQGYNYLLGY